MIHASERNFIRTLMKQCDIISLSQNLLNNFNQPKPE
jgi:hypothetical protein